MTPMTGPQDTTAAGVAVAAQQLGIAVQALRAIRDNVSAETDWRDTEAFAGNALDAIFALGAMPDDEPEPDADPEARYALVEQMGYRQVTGTVREVQFTGRPMLEVTDLRDGTVRLVGGDSLYQVTWLTREQAQRNVAPPKAISWGCRDDEEDDDPEVAENGGVWGFTEADL